MAEGGDMNRDEETQDAYHKLAFCASCVRGEIRSGGEAFKALEILEREVNKAIAALSSCACGGKVVKAKARAWWLDLGDVKTLILIGPGWRGGAIEATFVPEEKAAELVEVLVLTRDALPTEEPSDNS